VFSEVKMNRWKFKSGDIVCFLELEPLEVILIVPVRSNVLELLDQNAIDLSADQLHQIKRLALVSNFDRYLVKTFDNNFRTILKSSLEKWI
jgi:hypothetical protein